MEDNVRAPIPATYRGFWLKVEKVFLSRAQVPSSLGSLPPSPLQVAIDLLCRPSGEIDGAGFSIQ